MRVLHCHENLHYPSPPPSRMHEGPHAYSHFSRERGYFLPWSWEDFQRKPGKGGRFAIANGNQYPRYTDCPKKITIGIWVSIQWRPHLNWPSSNKEIWIFVKQVIARSLKFLPSFVTWMYVASTGRLCSQLKDRLASMNSYYVEDKKGPTAWISFSQFGKPWVIKTVQCIFSESSPLSWKMSIIHPPPPTPMLEGPHAYSHFLGKGVVFFLL